MQTVAEISKRLDWDYYYTLRDKYKWVCISENPVQYSEEFMEEFFDKLDWNSMFHFKKISSEFIDRHYEYFVHKVGIPIIVYYQQLTESFISKHYKSFNSSIFNFDIWQSVVRMNKYHISKEFFIKYIPKSIVEVFELTGEFK